MPHYFIYGLDLYSDQHLPGLLPMPEKVSITSTTRLWFGPLPEKMQALVDEKGTNADWFTGSRLIEKVKIRSIRQGMYFCLSYDDGSQFFLDRSGTQIWVTWQKNLLLEDIITYLVGPILGFVLRLKGLICLHASAIAVDGQAVAFAGESHSGKSTTAAALAHMGYPVLSDNIVALVAENGHFLALPAYPHIRLRTESVAAIYGHPEALPLISSAQPDWDKRYLDLRGEGQGFQTEPLPVAAIYHLKERVADEKAPFIEELSLLPAKLVISENTYKRYMLDDTMLLRELAGIDNLVEQVPVLQVTPHQSTRLLNLMCERILASFRTVQKRNLAK